MLPRLTSCDAYMYVKFHVKFLNWDLDSNEGSRPSATLDHIGLPTPAFEKH